jgi:ABC-type multidrug transport system fused ATPase/permease subunit
MVFEKGHIVERGTYDQLMSTKGHFYKLEKGL